MHLNRSHAGRMTTHIQNRINVNQMDNAGPRRRPGPGFVPAGRDDRPMKMWSKQDIFGHFVRISTILSIIKCWLPVRFNSVDHRMALADPLLTPGRPEYTL
jgi:hypothetical protein